MEKLWTEHQVLTDESTSSSEGGSGTGTSSDASFSLDHSVVSRNNRFVGRFVTRMVDLIDSKLASYSFQTHTNGESSVSQGSRASSVSFGSQYALTASDQNKSSCKRKINEHEEGDDDDDEEDSQRKRRGTFTQADDADGRDFACHFFKHNPQKYAAMKRCRCSTAGWRSIHRLKYDSPLHGQT